MISVDFARSYTYITLRFDLLQSIAKTFHGLISILMVPGAIVCTETAQISIVDSGLYGWHGTCKRPDLPNRRLSVRS
jgi:hypothetical protein